MAQVKRAPALHGQRPRVLVVDDDDDHLHLAAAALALRYRVVTARTGRDALRLLLSTACDALVVDYHLPDLSAPDILASLAGSGRALPAVVLTSQPSERDARAALRQGAADYLVKGSGAFNALPQILSIAIARHGQLEAAEL